MTSKQNQLTQENRLKIKRWSNRIACRLSTKYDLLNGRFGWFTEWPTGLRQKLEKEKTVVTRSPRHFLLPRSQRLKFLNGRWPGPVLTRSCIITHGAMEPCRLVSALNCLGGRGLVLSCDIVACLNFEKSPSPCCRRMILLYCRKLFFFCILKFLLEPSTCWIDQTERWTAANHSEISKSLAQKGIDFTHIFGMLLYMDSRIS